MKCLDSHSRMKIPTQQEQSFFWLRGVLVYKTKLFSTIEALFRVMSYTIIACNTLRINFCNKHGTHADEFSSSPSQKIARSDRISNVFTQTRVAIPGTYYSVITCVWCFSVIHIETKNPPLLRSSFAFLLPEYLPCRIWYTYNTMDHRWVRSNNCVVKRIKVPWNF